MGACLMMSGLVPTTTMCWLFWEDMCSFESGAVWTRASEEIFAGAGREKRAEALQRGRVQNLLLVQNVDRVLVGDDDQALRAERHHGAAVHACDQDVLR